MTLPFFPDRLPDRLPHLDLRRVEIHTPRRKNQGRPGPRPAHSEQGPALQKQVDAALEVARGKPQPIGIDPALIMKVRTTSPVDEANWRRAGLRVVADERNHVQILFTSDVELIEFRQRLGQYSAGDRQKTTQASPNYAWLADLDPASFVPLGPEDRQGRLLQILLAGGGPDPDVRYSLDIDCWYLGTDTECAAMLNQIENFLTVRQGTMTDRYVGRGMCLARIQIPGRSITELLDIRGIATADLPPRASHSVTEVIQANLGDFPELTAPEPDAPRVCVIDSGLATGHPLLSDAIAETIAVPSSLGNGLDVCGHGSLVAGVALYRDVEICRRARRFAPTFWIGSARVTNEDNCFDDERLITTQMREAIEYFHGQGYRIFNISLAGDPAEPFDGGRSTPWAASLDNLAHERDILIIVSSGNYDHERDANGTAQATRQGYPTYLLEPNARLLDPAMATNVLTVGAIAREGLPYWGMRFPNDIAPRPVAGPDQPAPFTRAGPGVRDAIKPDLVEYGGNYAYDVQRNCINVRDQGLAIESLNWQHATGPLFTFDVGTSFAAPRVTHLAAQLLRTNPTMSANLLRALLAHSARIPDGVKNLGLTADQQFRLCGYGQADLLRASYSSSNRVTLIGEDEVAMDYFHVYEIPIPPILRSMSGTRRIGVTLAFDPPVRHRNADYLGCSLDFHLYRGVALDDLVLAFKKLDDPKSRYFIPDSRNCDFKPGFQQRTGGTLQHGEWLIQRNGALDYEEPFYLVIRNERKWQRPTDDPQRYAVVVSLEHEALIDLYSPVWARSQVSQRVRF